MDAMQAILSRRSIRKYTPEKVDDHLLEELLEAAMSAPSAGNEQPWHFIVMTDRAMLDEFPKFHPYSGPVKGASAAIVVCGDLLLEKYKDCWVQDCSAAIQNILLAAAAKGLGAVWLGLFPDPLRVESAQKLLSLPQHIIPLALVPIGYPAERKDLASRFNPSRIHYHHW